MAATASSPVRWIQQIGGSGSNTIAGMATDAGGNIYVAGTTTSVDLPVRSAFQAHPASSALIRIDGPGNAWTNLYQPNVVSISAVRAAPSSPGTLYAVAGLGLIRTTDGGANWTEIAKFSNALRDVALDPSNNSVLYAAIAGQGVLKSIDGGATFQLAGSSPQDATALWTDTLKPNVIFAATGRGLARSGDGGASWKTTYATNVSSLAFDPFTAGVLYLTNYGAAARSNDDGATWTPLNVTGFQPSAIIADPRHLGVLYGKSGYGANIFVSSDSGATWESSATKLPGAVTLLVADSMTGAIYMSVSLSPQPAFSAIPIANGNPRGDQIFVTNDRFATVTQVGPPTVAQVTSMAVSRSGLFVGTQASPDVYVAKFDASGNLLRLTYFGGSGIDTASAMAVNSSGEVFVDGTTTSMDLPVTAGAFATTGQTFLFKLNPDGSLAWSTYFTDSLTSPGPIALDAAGRAIITGVTFNDLPVTPGAYKSRSGASALCAFPIGCVSATPDHFVTEFDANGSSLVFSTYFDGPGGAAIAADGSAIVMGGSAIYRLSADGSTVTATSKALGTTGGVLIAKDGSLYVAGNYRGTSFPATTGAFQTAPLLVPSLPGGFGGASGVNGFVAKLDANLNVLAATLFGGESVTSVNSLGLAADGSVLIGGGTSSYALPQKNTIWAPFSNNTGYIAQFSPDLSTLNFSTFAGDADGFVVRSVAYAADGSLLLAGSTVTGVPRAFVDAIAPGQTALQIDSAGNAANRQQVPFSPGETLDIRGSGFTASSTVLLNGVPAPATILSSGRIAATVPTDLAAQYVTVQVQDGGSTSNSLLSPVAATSPGIFSQDGSGFGQGYILNQDGTLNSPSNPALEGSPITICATGVGSMSFTGPYAVTDSPVNIYVDGFYANGIAATLGPVEGLPGNVYKIGVYVPRPSDNAAGNPNLKDFAMPPLVSVRMNVNGVNSQAGLALSVRHQ